MNGGKQCFYLVGVLIVITGIALVDVQVMEGNGKDMQNHASSSSELRRFNHGDNFP